MATPSGYKPDPSVKTGSQPTTGSPAPKHPRLQPQGR